MLSFLLVLWKNEYFVFVALKESLFARNHRLVLLNSLLTVANNTGMLQFEKNRLLTDYYQTLLGQESLRRLASH